MSRWEMKPSRSPYMQLVQMGCLYGLGRLQADTRETRRWIFDSIITGSHYTSNTGVVQATEMGTTEASRHKFPILRPNRLENWIRTTVAVRTEGKEVVPLSPGPAWSTESAQACDEKGCQWWGCLCFAMHFLQLFLSAPRGEFQWLPLFCDLAGALQYSNSFHWLYIIHEFPQANLGFAGSNFGYQNSETRPSKLESKKLGPSNE